MATTKTKKPTVKKTVTKKDVKAESFIDMDKAKKAESLSAEQKHDILTTLMSHDMLKKILALVLGGFLGAFAITFFIEPANLLSSGVTGISLSLSRITGLSFDAYTLIINLPLFVFGMFFVGKKFSIFSMAFAGIIVLWRIPLTNVDLNILSDPTGNDRLLAVIFGSSAYGIAVSILFKHGVSTGGVDYITVFISQRKQIAIGKLSILMLLLTLLTASLMETLHKFPGQPIKMFNETLGYTLIAVFIEGKIIDSIYPKYKKFRVAFTTTEENAKKICNHMMEIGYNRTFTLFDTVGSYTGKASKTVVTICSYYEVAYILEKVKTIDPNLFAIVTRVDRVEGKFDIK